MPLTLHTERLRIRPFTPADAPFLVDLNADPEVYRYTGDGPVDLPGAVGIVDYILGKQHPFGMARLVCELDGVPVGWCGLRRLEPDEIPDLGYRFFRRVWGRGLATEASRAVLAAGFARDDVHRIRAEADARNPGSIRVMEKLGMTLHRRWTDEEGPAVEYRLSREDWGARADWSGAPG